MRNSLLLLFILHLMICPAVHEFQDFKETEILSSTPILENPHHHNLMANRESKFQHFDLLNASFFVIPLLAINPFQQPYQYSLSPLSSGQQASVLRC
jgi:hypothetical protein